jgi:hypothetical protein
LTNGRAGQLMSSSIVNYVFRRNRLATAHEGKTNENLFSLSDAEKFAYSRSGTRLNELLIGHDCS